MLIFPIKNKYYNCFDANIISISTSKNRDYCFLFSNYFYFGYFKKGNRIISENIQEFIDKKEDIFHTYHGVERIKTKYKNKDHMLEKIREYIDNETPVMIKSDVFYCSWNVLYNVQHINHFFLIIGYTEKKIICLDPYFTTEQIIIDEDDLFFPKNDCFYTFRIKDIPNISKNDAIDLMIEGLSEYNNIDIFSHFQLFKQDIRNINYDIELSESKSIYTIPLIRALKSIEYNRRCYIELLAYIGKRFGIYIGNMIMEMEELCNSWSRFRIMLLKCLLKKTIEQKYENIENVINEIYRKECYLVNELYNYFSKAGV